LIDTDKLSQEEILHLLATLDRDRKIELIEVLEAKRLRYDQSQLFRLFPDEDTLLEDGSVIHARGKYPRHLEFFEVGKEYRERCLMAANRVGKTYGGGGYEMALHLTGFYPDWWPGRVFDHPIRAWAAGKTNETTRDIVQAVLLGDIKHDGPRKGVSGTGLIPGWLLGQPTWKQGVQDLVDMIKIQHVTGGWSTLGMKSYQQGRGSFEGTAQHVIWGDEEPPLDVYGEMLIRTATTDGIVMLTFTPLEGISDTVLQFLPKAESGVM
jgi:phage terminase large subunit-like protein